MEEIGLVDTYANKVMLGALSCTTNKNGEVSFGKLLQDNAIIRRADENAELSGEAKNIYMYVIDDYLTNEKKYLEKNKEGFYKITPKGYAYFSETESRIISRKAFCAMHFHDKLDAYYDAVDEATKNAGYTLTRIDRKPHNNDINAEILLEIRQSRFIIADFTNERGGVYFEAGYAKGFGVDVIYTCEQTQFDSDKPHFDVQHYNFILWEKGNIPKFIKDLTERIQITLPVDVKR